jgi:hypothetical protein
MISPAPSPTNTNSTHLDGPVGRYDSNKRENDDYLMGDGGGGDDDDAGMEID